MRHLQRGFAVSVVVTTAMSVAGLGAAEPEGLALTCCPGGDHGQQLNSTGLGQSHPSAVDLSLDAAWRVYGFTRDGVEYFQVNDVAGRVQLIIGSLDGLFWALPAGEVSRQLVFPSQQFPVPHGASRSEVYRHSAFSLVRYRTDDDAVWAVEVPSGER